MVMDIDRALEVLDQIPTIGEQVDALELAIEALKESVKEYTPTDDNAVLIVPHNICLKGREMVELRFKKPRRNLWVKRDALRDISVPKGEWEKTTGGLRVRCSNCNAAPVTRIIETRGKETAQADWCFSNRVSNIFKYCPKCGADMRKKEGKHE